MIPLTGAGTATTSLTVVCRAGNQHPVSVNSVALTAIRVASLN